MPAAKKLAFGTAVLEAEVAGKQLERVKEVVKQGLSEYFLFTIEGREDIKDREPKRLVALKAAEVPLECLYKLTDRDNVSPRPFVGEGPGVRELFTKFYRFKNIKLLETPEF
jgi:hypothetical protein